MIPVTCGHARISKTDDDTRNPETRLHVLQEFGIPEERILNRRDDCQLPVPLRLECADDPSTAHRHRLAHLRVIQNQRHQRPPKRLTENDLRA